MDWYVHLALYLSVLITLFLVGIPVAISFLATNIIGWLIVTNFDYYSMLQIVDNTSSMISRFTLGPVPLFILMGSLFFHTGLAIRVFNTLDLILGRIPGRLSILTLFGGTAFSTLIGSSMANTAMLGTLILPEMQKRGYSKQMMFGPILGTSGLAIIIPPSSIAVLLASIANIDVGKFLIAGIIPGFLLAILYLFALCFQIWRRPDSTPSYTIHKQNNINKYIEIIKNIIPMGFVIFCVIGVIIFGIATPTESAAFGVISVILLALLYRQCSYNGIKNALDDSIKISGAIFFILMNSAVFSQLLAFSGASKGLMNFALSFDLAPVIVLAIIILILLFIGMFMDSTSIMLISVPILFPIALSLNIDPLLFALIVLITIEMAGITPPFGVVLYVMMGIAPKGTTLYDLVRAALPFLVCDLLLIVLVLFFPAIVLWLPNIL